MAHIFILIIIFSFMSRMVDRAHRPIYALDFGQSCYRTGLYKSRLRLLQTPHYSAWLRKTLLIRRVIGVVI